MGRWEQCSFGLCSAVYRSSATAVDRLNAERQAADIRAALSMRASEVCSGS